MGWLAGCIPIQATGYGPLNLVSWIGAVFLATGFALIFYNVIYSIMKSPRERLADPWDGRTLEWSIPSPAPFYNFAITPTVQSEEPVWDYKKKDIPIYRDKIKPIHMPSNSGKPVIMGSSSSCGASAWYLAGGFHQSSSARLFSSL